MRIDRVKYTAHYDEFGILKDQWIGLEAQIDDTEVPEKQLDAIKEITEQWYKKQNIPLSHQQYPPFGPPPNGNPYHVPVIDKAEERRIGIMADDIMSCQELTTLDTYRLLVKGKLELEAAYNLRREQIIAIEKKDILNRTNALTNKQQP